MGILASKKDTPKADGPRSRNRLSCDNLHNSFRLRSFITRNLVAYSFFVQRLEVGSIRQCDSSFDELGVACYEKVFFIEIFGHEDLLGLRINPEVCQRGGLNQKPGRTFRTLGSTNGFPSSS